MNEFDLVIEHMPWEKKKKKFQLIVFPAMGERNSLELFCR
jgi:hypothetical protein